MKPAQPSHRSQSPNKPGKEPDGTVFGVVELPGHEKAFWSRIGVAFTNRDGSISLKFDFFPRDPETRIQLRWKEENGARAGLRGPR